MWIWIVGCGGWMCCLCVGGWVGVVVGWYCLWVVVLEVDIVGGCWFRRVVCCDGIDCWVLLFVWVLFDGVLFVDLLWWDWGGYFWLC